MKLLRYGPAGQEKPGLLDRDGKISRFAVVYDSSLLPDAQYHALVALSAEN